MNKFHSRHQTGEEEDGVNIFTFDGPTFEDINHVDLCYWLRVFGQGDQIHLRDQKDRLYMVPNKWVGSHSPFSVELYGKLGRPYTRLKANGPIVVELYGKALYGARSGAIPIWLRSSSLALCGMRTRKSTMAGPGKEAAAICGAFVRHTPRFHH